MIRQTLTIAASAAVVTASGIALAVTTSAPAAAGTALRPFADCEGVRTWYAAAAMPMVTAWGLAGGGSWLAGAGGMEDSAGRGVMAAQAEGVDSAADEAVGNGGTGTNVQEAGVDEPDVAKTDGRIVLHLRGGRLEVVDVTGAVARPLGSVELGHAGEFTELLLVGQRAVVLGTRYDPVRRDGWPSDSVSDRSTGSLAEPIVMPTTETALMTTVDVSDPSSPQVVRSEQVEGRVVSARQYDGTVRVVLTSTPALPFVTPDRATSERDALAHNRRLVRAASAADWLPRHADGRPLVPCADVRHPERAAGLGTLSVLTFAPASPEDLDITAVAAGGDLVYSSDDRLYVATTSGGWLHPAPASWGGAVREAAAINTEVHAFDVSGSGTRYVASGSVPGSVHSRWAFSEYDGRLRVATMLGDTWQPTDNGISVLEERGRRLHVVGSVAGMGLTEQIRAVRWFGDVAVVVTFRQTDPLYTVDLSDPSRPRVLGELKVPGFSAYLHPLGDDLLLGVGQDATRQGELLGAQAATFDLSRLESPGRLDALGLGHYTESAVEHDSRAFTYLARHRLALVPLTSWALGPHSRLEVVAVGSDGRLDVVDTVTLPQATDGTVRALPIERDRVAVVTGSDNIRILQIAGTNSAG
jgi:uncharacterized secreted protein with C-terminal beta-propeller domain